MLCFNLTFSLYRIVIVSSRNVATSKPMRNHKAINLHSALMQTLLAYHPNFASMASSINQSNIKLFVVRWVKLLNQFFFVLFWLTTLLSNLSPGIRRFCVILFCFHFNFCVFTFFSDHLPWASKLIESGEKKRRNRKSSHREGLGKMSCGEMKTWWKEECGEISRQKWWNQKLF